GLLQLFLEGGRDRDGVEHGVDRDLAVGGRLAAWRRLDALEDRNFAQGNTELLIGLENLGIDLLERADLLLRLRRRVIVEILVVDLGVVDASPGRLLHGQPTAEGLKAPFQHPGRLILLARDETDRVLRQALRGLVGLDQRLESITVLIDVDPPNAIDRLLYGWHSILRSRFQGPRWNSPKLSYDALARKART